MHLNFYHPKAIDFLKKSLEFVGFSTLLNILQSWTKLTEIGQSNEYQVSESPRMVLFQFLVPFTLCKSGKPNDDYVI